MSRKQIILLAAGVVVVAAVAVSLFWPYKTVETTLTSGGVESSE